MSEQGSPAKPSNRPTTRLPFRGLSPALRLLLAQPRGACVPVKVQGAPHRPVPTEPAVCPLDLQGQPGMGGHKQGLLSVPCICRDGLAQEAISRAHCLSPGLAGMAWRGQPWAEPLSTARPAPEPLLAQRAPVHPGNPPCHACDMRPPVKGGQAQLLIRHRPGTTEGRAHLGEAEGCRSDRRRPECVFTRGECF